jgi:hypothetical protein
MLIVGGVVAAAIAAVIASFSGAPASSEGGRFWSAEHGHYNDARGVHVP